MEDLIIPIIIFFAFLVLFFFTLKKENFAENKFLIFSLLFSIIGIFTFTILQISVSDFDITQQNEFDYNKKENSFWIIIIAYFIAIVLNLISPRKTWLNFIALTIQIIVFFIFIALKFIALSFIL
ncbi:hypothetical protein AAH994_15260 [Weeksellaceae bacterium A-14]